MDEIAAMDVLDQMIRETDDPEDIPDEFMLTGAIVVGLYSSVDGTKTGERKKVLGNMSYYTQRGLFDHYLQECKTMQFLGFPDPDEDEDEE